MTDFKKSIVEKYGKDATIDMLFGILDALPTPLNIKDDALQSLYLNEANSDLDGRSIEPSTTDEQKLLRSRKPVTRVETVQVDENKTRQFETHEQCVRFKQGGKAQKVIFNVKQDCTDLADKQTELVAAKQSLETNNARIRHAIDSLDSGFVVWDSEDRLVLCNDAFREQFGFLPDVSEGRTFEEMFLEFAQSGVVKDAVGRENEWVAEHVKLRKKELGKEIIFETHDGRWMMRRDVLNANGDRVGIRTDITEIQENREQLSLASKAIEEMSSAVIIKDADGRYCLVNERFGKYLGFNPSDMIGKTTVDVTGAETAAEFEVREKRVLETGQEIEFEECFQLASGEMIDAITTIQRIEDQNGNFYVCILVNDVSEIRRREEELAKKTVQIEANQKRMETFAETSADWFWEMDADLKLTYLSEGVRTFVGLDPKSTIGKSRRELWQDEQERDEIDRHLEDLDNHRAFKQFVYPMMSPKDGSTVYIEVSGTPILDEKGEFTGYMGTGRNVTRQMDRQKALENAKAEIEINQERFRTFAETNADWFWEMDSQFRFSYLSESFEKITGASRDQILNKTNEELGIEGISEEAFQEHLACLKRHEPFRDFLRPRQLPDGSEVWLAIGGMPIFDKDGTFQGYQGSGRNVTEQVLRERALEEATKRAEILTADLQSTIDSLDLGVVVVDRDLKTEMINSAFYDIWNIEDVTFKKGVKFRELMDVNRHAGIYDVEDENWDAYVASREDGIRTGNIAGSEIVRADGVHLLYSVTNLNNGRRLISYYDFTDQKVRERELDVARENALLADRAKSEFLANMSHEIRTPMNGVMGMAELLTKTELDAKQKMFTDVIVKSGASLLTIINDILDFSKLDAGQMELDPAPFQLAEAIEDVATLVSSRVAEKDLELIVRVDPNLPQSMVGDVGRIRQIVTNLMGNAVKFTEQGHVYVNVNEVPSCLKTDRRRLRFEVKDTGIGIPQEKCKAVFEKFSQVDTSSSRKHEGTGLGLTIASSLVEIMGGEIGVESKVGEGSTFWFEIELPVDEANKKERHVPVDVTGARVLIVDDNEVNRSILSEQMTAWKFDSAAAVDGFEALAVMKAACEQNITIDCVVLDYHMPGMNGGEVVKRMRADALMADIPVIMLTSVDQTEDGKVFSSLGIQAHLTKPARSSHLLESIIAILQDKAEADREALAEQAAQLEIEASQIVDARQVVSQAPSQPAPEIVETPAQPKQDHGIDVLVCEDNEVNQIVFTQILQAADYTFEIASNGRKGVEMMKQLSPKLILMDVSMPELNGLEATGQIREYESGSGTHTPIIGVTAHAIKGDMEKCIAAGMDDYLSKPVSPDRLQEKIANWMNTIRDVREA